MLARTSSSKCAACSNRTIVGLKQQTVKQTRYTCFRQQSHHCGIETGNSPPFCKYFAMQQSHHCGIETNNWQSASARKVKSSNRTIVGLKHRRTSGVAGWWLLQQSHHCGIETGVAEQGLNIVGLAAIAPLWD